jgi:hypothetical protein
MIIEWDSAPDPVIESDDEDDNDNTANLIPANQAAIPNAAGPAGPPMPALPAGNPVSGGREYADWTVTCFSKWFGTEAINMEHLFYKLVDQIARPAWIEGRDLWEEYRSAEDLEKVVVRGR